MKILAFDTTMQACSASFLDTEKEEEQHSVYESLDRGHAEALLPMIEAVMQVGGCGYQELDRVGVTLGPGAFTGVRVGVATARGIGLSVDAEVFGFSSLHVMAVKAFEVLGKRFLADFGQMIVASDARRGEIYLQAFDIFGHPESEAQAVKPDTVFRYLKGKKTIVVGSGGKVMCDLPDLADLDVVFKLPDLLPDAQSMCQLVLSGEGVIPSLSPLYLRAPDAKPQIGKQIARV